MDNLSRKACLALGAAIVAVSLPAANAFAQDGVARLANGQPDISGTWRFREPSAPPPEDPRGLCVVGCAGVFGGPPAAGPSADESAAPPAPRGPRVQFPVYREEHLEEVARLNREQVLHDTALRCQNPGIPRVGTPDKIMQTEDQVVFLYDDLNGAFWRIIPTDGRPQRDDREPGPMGNSVGHWEGDTLVIETIDFTPDTWLTDNGALHGWDMRTVEEVSLTEDGGLHYKLTVHDPEYLAEPFVKERTLLLSEVELLQPVPCVERSIGAMVGIESYHPNPRW